MSVNARTPDKGNATDPRDRNILCGIDTNGYHHVYQTRSERVVVVDPESGVIHDRSFDGIDIHDWMDAVEDRYGLDEQYMYRDASEALLADLERIVEGA